MVLKLKKIQAMLVSKRKNTIPEDLIICINDVDIKPKNSVGLLGITLDNKPKILKTVSVQFVNLQAVN